MRRCTAPFTSCVNNSEQLPAGSELYSNHPIFLVRALERMRHVRLHDHVAEQVHAERQARAEHRNALRAVLELSLRRALAFAGGRCGVDILVEAEPRILVRRPGEARVEEW